MDNLKFRILIVEDVKIAQKMAVLSLQSLNCELDVASNGAEALEYFNRYQYDLIFMDLGLPDMDGITVTETIRKMEGKEKRDTVIIALTAHNEKYFKECSISSGMNDFMVKPLTYEVAEKCINRYLGKSRTFRKDDTIKCQVNE